VGYSTPEHREAIERLGVSPLHRLSFQSMAYQQLALGDPGGFVDPGMLAETVVLAEPA
jgi:hypothetical protein